MDSAFVTPLVVTQGLNLLVNTFLPWVGRKAIIAARSKVRQTADSLDENVIRMKQLILTNQATAMTRMKELTAAAVPNMMTMAKSSTRALEAGKPAAAEADDPTKPKDADNSTVTGLQPLSQAPASEPAPTSQAVADKVSSASASPATLALVSSDSLGRNKYAKTTIDLMEKIYSDLVTVNQSGLGDMITVKDKFVCRSYSYNADSILEEGGLSFWSPFSDLLHQCIQFSYITLFSVVWPFCSLCGFVNNKISIRFDIIKMCMDFKRPMPQRTSGIGSWENVLFFEAMLATMIVPGLYVACTGGYDAYWGCSATETDYGPQTDCLSFTPRLVAFIILENIGLGIVFLVNSSKSDISTATKRLIAWRGRKLKTKLRESLALIGRKILVESSHERGEWREATVAWIKRGVLSVYYAEHCDEVGRPIAAPQPVSESEKWLDKALLPPESLDTGDLVLIKHTTQSGTWMTGKVLGTSNILDSGEELQYTPDTLLVTIFEASNVRDDDSFNAKGELNAFCIVRLGAHVESTPVCADTSSPEWNASFKLYESSRQETLKVSILNSGDARDNNLGEVLIPLSQVADGKFHDTWYDMKSQSRLINLTGSTNERQSATRLRIGIRWIDSRLPVKLQVQQAHPASSEPIWMSRQAAGEALRQGISGTEMSKTRRRVSQIGNA